MPAGEYQDTLAATLSVVNSKSALTTQASVHQLTLVAGVPPSLSIIVKVEGIPFSKSSLKI